MIIDDFKRVVRENRRPGDRAFLLNLLKEELQSYVLFFIYTRDEFKSLIFTGGTCLRRVFGLNRLSVDVDFDYDFKRSPVSSLRNGLATWFRKEHQLRHIESVARKESIKIKLGEMSRHVPEIGKEIVFVSVDLSPLRARNYRTEHNLVSTPEFSFIVRNYDLPTMLANKMIAFLSRRFRAGRDQAAPFKARDVYDLFWLCQRSKREQYRLRPDFERLCEELRAGGKEEVLLRLKDKIASVEDRQLLAQLMPFFPDPGFVKSFVSAYREALAQDLEHIFSE